VVEQRSDLAGLARAARAGDRAAVDALLAELQPIVVRAVRLVVGSGSALAEDACQEALLDIAKGLPRLAAPEHAVAWAMRIAMRRAIRASRRHRLRFDLTGGHELLEQIPALDDVPGRLLEIREAFDTLPARIRAVAVLRIYVGLSEAETARALGCSIGTVKSRLHTARKRLQTLLADDAAPAAPLNPTGRSA
jgi:RNA polymerase sigma factor (sigma-70 family)